MLGFGCMSRIMCQGTEAICKQEVNELVRELKNRKAAGVERNTSEMIKIETTGCVTDCEDCVIKHLKIGQFLTT